MEVKRAQVGRLHREREREGLWSTDTGLTAGGRSRESRERKQRVWTAQG